MNRLSTLLPDRNTIKLLRFPFSFYLMPVYLLCLSQANDLNPATAFTSFLIIHFLVYPASNGYNSYVDKDTGSIGGLENPPLPTSRLYYTTLIMDLLAVLVATLLVNPRFAMCILLYIMASRAYSMPQIRLKKYPVAGFATVVFFQGAFTYYLSHLGITARPMLLNFQGALILLACSLQIAGAYPLTQIYQHREDLAGGVRSLSHKLGYNGTFIFTGLMFVLCNLCYYLYFTASGHFTYFIYLQLFFVPLVAYFIWWFRKVTRNQDEANYKNTMRMNQVASVCTGTCFIFFFYLKYFH
jgi:4-hydroxybenzoate polyprenyltransferase